MAIAADRNSDLFIDGHLVAGGAGRFPTVNPATEEVLGTAADADAEDMSRAIDVRPARVRHHRLVHQHRVAGALHPAVA